MRKQSRLFDVANFIHDPNYSLVQGRIGRGGSLGSALLRIRPCGGYTFPTLK